MTIKINQAALNKVLKTVDNAFAEVVTALDNEFHAVIEDTSEFSDLGLDNQDIIDTGRFNDSQVLNISTGSSLLTARSVQSRPGIQRPTR